MKKNKNSLSIFKKKSLSLSIAVILASSLSACGSSDSEPEVIDEPAIIQSELASGLLCIDSNNNGKCDEGEVSQEGFSATTIPENMKSRLCKIIRNNRWQLKCS